MFYVFILESIGTSELILIGLVALIVFGPRKLPEFARTLGKMMNEFRRTTDDFKQTWVREVEFESEERIITAKETIPSENPLFLENPMEKEESINASNFPVPEIKEINHTEFQKSLESKKNELQIKPDDKITDKRDWL